MRAHGARRLALAAAASASAAAAASCAPAFGAAWTLCRAPVPDARCIPATVPGTVLTALVANGTFAGVADLFVDNATATVPDISATGSDAWTFYWSTSIVVPAACADEPPTSTLALVLPQVNYRATVLVGGAEVAPVGGGVGARAAGMYARHTYALGAVGALAGTTTALAVRVAPPDHPGNTSSACKGCGQGGNHQAARNVASQDVAGWDWIAGVPDRNTGLLDEPLLQLAPSGLLLGDPVAAVVSMTLAPPAGGAAPRTAAAVQLRVRVGVLVLGGGGGGGGNTTGVLSLYAPTLGAGPLAQVALSLSPAQQAGQWLDVQLPDVALADVALWWPHNLGPPTLHAAHVQFVPAPAPAAAPAAAAPATTLAWALGVRSVTSEVDAALGGRVFRVNGARVFLQGGNYINADMFLRGRARSSRRYADEVRMHAAAGLNLLRLWGGSGGHPAALYAAADAAGVLVMLELWMSGDNNGRWAGNYSWPDDHALYLAAARDTLLLTRPHACVLLVCGGNELYPLAASPPPDIAAALPVLLQQLYPAQPPPYVQSSMGSTYGDKHAPPVFNPVSTLAPLDGPYGVLDEREFSTRNPGLFYGSNPPVRADAVPIAFQPELGSSACHEYESLARFLSPGALAAYPPVNASYDSPGVHPSWRYHNYLPFTDAGGWDHVYAYGAPRNTSEYAARAQLAQFVQYRALFEGFQRAQWIYYGAVIMWKSQTPWPAFRGALYDPYLATSGGFWGVRAATRGGAPLRVSLTYGNYSVAIVNAGLDALDLAGCELAVTAWDVATGGVVAPPSPLRLTGAPLAPGGVLNPPLTLAWPAGVAPGSTTLLYRLSLAAPGGAAELAHSDYWLANLSPDPAVPQDFASLGALRDAGPRVALTAAAAGGVGADGVLRVNVSLAAPPTAPGVALGVTVTLRDPAHPARAATGAVDDRVLPAWASHGYVCLVPGETLVVRIEADWAGRPAPGAGGLTVSVDGFTVQAQVVAVALAR